MSDYIRNPLYWPKGYMEVDTPQRNLFDLIVKTSRNLFFSLSVAEEIISYCTIFTKRYGIFCRGCMRLDNEIYTKELGWSCIKCVIQNAKRPVYIDNINYSLIKFNKLIYVPPRSVLCSKDYMKTPKMIKVFKTIKNRIRIDELVNIILLYAVGKGRGILCDKCDRLRISLDCPGYCTVCKFYIQNRNYVREVDFNNNYPIICKQKTKDYLFKTRNTTEYQRALGSVFLPTDYSINATQILLDYNVEDEFGYKKTCFQYHYLCELSFCEEDFYRCYKSTHIVKYENKFHVKNINNTYYDFINFIRLIRRIAKPEINLTLDQRYALVQCYMNDMYNITWNNDPDYSDLLI